MKNTITVVNYVVPVTRNSDYSFNYRFPEHLKVIRDGEEYPRMRSHMFEGYRIICWEECKVFIQSLYIWPTVFSFAKQPKLLERGATANLSSTDTLMTRYCTSSYKIKNVEGLFLPITLEQV